MKGMRKYSKYRLKETVICLVFLGFFTVRSNAQLGTPPIIIVQPLGLAVQNGGTAVLTTTAVSLTSMQFQWIFNGKQIKKNHTTVVNVVIPLVGTVSTLTLDDIDSSSEGTYSVEVKNGVGSVTSSNAALVVLTTTVSNVVNIVSAGTGMLANGFQIHLSGPPGSNYVIQASSDLKNWTPISTNAAPTGSVSYTDAAATNLSYRYYRAIIQ